jgi:hypothetical protein
MIPASYKTGALLRLTHQKSAVEPLVGNAQLIFP